MFNFFGVAEIEDESLDEKFSRSILGHRYSPINPD
jgi:hypothetical protein